MKTVKLNVKMCCKLVLFAALLGGCSGYPDYEVTNPPFVDITSLDMYIGDTVQITASPTDANIRWSSDNEEVIKVNQTGEVVALSEGLATITVASDNDELRIDARVRTFVPLTGISGIPDTISVNKGTAYQLLPFPIPADASEYSFIYRSENTDAVTVDKNGVITPVSEDTVNIIVSSGSIEKAVTVIILPLIVKCNVVGWTAESRNASHPWGAYGGQPGDVLDSNRNTGWHTASGSPLPQCLVVDMKETRVLHHIEFYHLPNAATNNWIYFRTIEVYLSNTYVVPDTHQPSWGDPIASYNYPGGFDGIIIDFPKDTEGRYLILYFPTSRSGTYISFTELDVYELL